MRRLAITRLVNTVLLTLIFSVSVAAGMAVAKERYAVIIANKTYKHTGNVRFADRDALAIEEALVNTMNVPRRNIIRYADVSKGDLQFLFGVKGSPGQLANLVSTENSELFVYFAGHGSKETRTGSVEPTPYLLATDSRPEALDQTGYSLELLIDQLNVLQRQKLSRGRVMLILESCFSGRSNDGDLIQGRSAPAFGRPVAIEALEPKTNDNVVVFAAAQGDQFAIWDQKWERSVFTDALVSGLYGEADSKSFSGNGDGKVTLGELENFVSSRIARRLRVVMPGERQNPDLLGGSKDLTLVRTERMTADWPEIVRRRHGEIIRSALLKTSSDMNDVQAYLTDCLYCPNKKELLARLRESKRQSTICSVEAEPFARVMKSTKPRVVSGFLEISRCSSHRISLETRLAALESGSTKITARPSIKIDPGTQDTASRLARQSIARLIQVELKRVGCLTGRVDGIWGRGSRYALRRFGQAKSLPNLKAPSEDVLRVVEDSEGRVCTRVLKPRDGYTAKKKSRRKSKSVTTIKQYSKPKRTRATTRKKSSKAKVKYSATRKQSSKPTKRRTKRRKPAKRAVKSYSKTKSTTRTQSQIESCREMRRATQGHYSCS